ncbi:Ras- protein Rab-26 [Clonorchis sinensis]|uniref:Ras- protein Rab-26 n=2 Tax=Clonorchis sinensis TaxID=79923 RepID=A0A8T1M940_CLOSI|nr:Ras- protein Rab-26 [Clonorchis sinensis]
MSTDSKGNIPTFKVLLVGDSCVGKTSLLIRFKDRIFLKGTYISTVGIDYKAKVVNANGIPVRLKIWDTAGQEKFRSLTKSYYRDSDAVVLVYDISRMDTLLHTKSWMDEITVNADSKTLLLLTGNKADEVRERAVSKRDGERVAKECGALFWETSAKTGQNVDAMFHSVAETLLSSSASESPVDKNGFALSSDKIGSTDSKPSNPTRLSGNIFRCCP